jgi:hypothetical protein
MKLWFGNDNGNFTICFNEESGSNTNEHELSLMNYALNRIDAQSLGRKITSMDSYTEDFVVNKSFLKVESDNWDTCISSADEKLIGKIRDIVEDKLNRDLG